MSPSRNDRLEQLDEIVRGLAQTLGLEVVELVFHSRGKHSLLRIDIDRAGIEGVGLRDCEALSRALDEHLERIEFFDAPYELQVSSPGLDRPIRTADDIRRNSGRAVRMEYHDGDHVREATGVLVGVTAEGAVELSCDGRTLQVQPGRILMMKQAVTSGGRRPPRA